MLLEALAVNLPPTCHHSMPEVVVWQAAQSQELIERAAARLAEGRLVALPTETGYEVAAAAACPEAVQHLAAVSGGEFDLFLGLGGPAWLADGMLGPLGRRFARRFWPGPLIVVSGEGLEVGWPKDVPEGLRPSLLRQGRLAYRCPDHDAPLYLLRYLGTPLILKAVSGPASPEQLEQTFGAALALLIADEGSRRLHVPTIVQVEGKTWEVLREGMWPAATLEQMTPFRIVFVCTGNTCRSPLAQALCTQLLAEHLGCPAQDLPRRGLVVESAGLYAIAGEAAAAEAVEAAREFGADLAGHRSRPVTLETLVHADFLFAMTQAHLDALSGYNVGGPRPRLLSPEGRDIVDPLGGSREVYRTCAEQILTYLREWLAVFAE